MLRCSIILVLSFFLCDASSVQVERIDLQLNWPSLINLHHDQHILKSIGLSAAPSSKFFDNHRCRIALEQENKDIVTTYQITLTNGQFIGFIMLCPITPTRCEISYMIAPDYWNKGYGKESVRMLCREILPRSNQKLTLWAIVCPENYYSQKILRNAGFIVNDSPNILLYEDMEYELQIN